MKRIALWVLLLLIAVISPALAVDLFTFIAGRTTATTPGATDYYPLTQGGVTKRVPGTSVLYGPNNLSDISSAPTARTNLGLGALATVSPGVNVASALAIGVGSAGAFLKNNGDAISGTYSGNFTLSGIPSLSNALTGTQTRCLGLSSGNVLVASSGGCGSASAGIPGGTTNDLQTNDGSGGFGAITAASGVSTFLATPSSANLAAALTTKTGSGNAVFATSPALVTPILGTPASGNGANLVGIPISTGLTGAGTGGLTALGTNVGTAGAFVVNGGALGTPSSGNGASITGIVNNNVLATTFATGTTVTLTAPRQYYECTGTCTITLPVPAAGYEFCARNANNIGTVITFAAIGSSARYENTGSTAYGTAGTGTFVSGGAVGDKVCFVGKDSTHYDVFSYSGSWTAN